MSTDRKERILLAALELFALEGYHATPTSKIAKQAEVSEGLIFRHYKNKEGLLQAILQAAERNFQQHLSPILEESNPQKTLRFYISFPFEVPEEEVNFWRLQFKLKWEVNYPKNQKLTPFLDKITWAFRKLGYDNPELEAELLFLTIEGVSTAILRDGMERMESTKNFLLKKYGV